MHTKKNWNNDLHGTVFLLLLFILFIESFVCTCLWHFLINLPFKETLKSVLFLSVFVLFRTHYHSIWIMHSYSAFRIMLVEMSWISAETRCVGEERRIRTGSLSYIHSNILQHATDSGENHPFLMCCEFGGMSRNALSRSLPLSCWTSFRLLLYLESCRRGSIPCPLQWEEFWLMPSSISPRRRLCFRHSYEGFYGETA